MPNGRLYLDVPTDAARALVRGSAFASSVDATHPVVVYGAPFSGASIVLGAYQHAPHALAAGALSQRASVVLRRDTGGSAVWASEGVLYVALGLLDASVLMKCPPGRLLNRNVRGALSGLRSLGVPTNYFGRDFLSFGKDPGAYVAWDERGDGRVLLEFFVALTTSFGLPAELSGYPQASEPALRGKAPIALSAATTNLPSAEGVLRAIASGYAKGFGVEFEELPLGSAGFEPIAALAPAPNLDPTERDDLSWSDPHEEAIGFVSAGVRLDDDGRIAALTVGGDFFQQRECPQRLAAALHGAVPDARAIGAALDRAYAHRPGLIEGVRTLQTLQTAILQAVQKAS